MKIAFFGLGAMGEPMAGHLLKAGYKDQISRLSTLEEVYAVVKAIKRDLR